jgi:tetratricopeptide (TPR) repeat protein
MSKHILLSGLTLVSVILATAANSYAELAPGISPLTIKRIERSQTPERNNNRTYNNNYNNRQVATNSERSMQYVRLGLASQKRGNERQALIHYYSALKLDQTNAVAFMAAGNLLGETEEGITCMKAAVILFQRQGNQEGYELATAWLQERGVGE